MPHDSFVPIAPGGKQVRPSGLIHLAYRASVVQCSPVRLRRAATEARPLDVLRIDLGQFFGQAFDCVADLRFGVVRGDEEPQTSGFLLDGRMQNRLHVDAPLLHRLRNLQAMDRVAQDYGHYGRVFAITGVHAPALGQARGTIASIITQISDALGLVFQQLEWRPTPRPNCWEECPR